MDVAFHRLCNTDLTESVCIIVHTRITQHEKEPAPVKVALTMMLLHNTQIGTQTLPMVGAI